MGQGSLRQNHAILLYGTVFASSLFFFLLGVWVGRSFLGAAAPQELAEQEQPTEVDPSDLDFYRQMESPESAPPDQRPSLPPKTGESRVVVVTPPATADPQQPARPALDEPAPLVKKPTESTSATPWFTVQVGALKTRREAQQVALRLRAKGYSADLIEPSVLGDAFYRVWVGSFDSRSEARVLEQQLKEDDFPTFIKRLTVGRPTSE